MRKDFDYTVGELELFINNDEQIYTDLLVPAYRSCEKSFEKNNFNANLALRLFRSIVTYGANKYKSTINNELNATMRVQKQVALNLLSDFEYEYKLGIKHTV